jgi:hypothetical protein
VETDSREISKVRSWKRQSLNWRVNLMEGKARFRAVSPYKEEKKKKKKKRLFS